MKRKYRLKTLVVIIALVIAMTLTACSKDEPETVQTVDISTEGIRKVCELSTMELYFHNVAELTQEAAPFLEDILKIGYKKCWIEYECVAKVGVDASKITVNIDQNDPSKVKVFIPEAEFFSIKVPSDSISEPLTDKGLFTADITVEEKSQIVDAAQKILENKLESDVDILQSAKKRAEEIIKSYIKTVGESVGQELTVVFTNQQ